MLPLPQGSFPGDPPDQLLEEPALYFPRIHLHLPITTSRFSLPTFASSLTIQALVLQLHFCFSWQCSQLPPHIPGAPCPACAGSHLGPSSCPVPVQLPSSSCIFSLGSGSSFCSWEQWIQATQKMFILQHPLKCLFCCISFHSYSRAGWEDGASSAAEPWCHHGLGDLELPLVLQSRDWALPKVVKSIWEENSKGQGGTHHPATGAWVSHGTGMGEMSCRKESCSRSQPSPRPSIAFRGFVNKKISVMGIQ